MNNQNLKPPIAKRMTLAPSNDKNMSASHLSQNQFRKGKTITSISRPSTGRKSAISKQSSKKTKQKY